MRNATSILALLLLLTLPAIGAAQQPASPSPARPQTQPPAKGDKLAEAARQARQAQKNAPKAAVVYTNDNLPTSPGAVSVVGQVQPPAKPGAKSGPQGKLGASGAKQGEAYWRKKFTDARTKLRQDQEDLAVLRRELGELRLQYYPDPAKALQEGYTRSDIDKKQKQIAQKVQSVKQDQQAIADLEDALRRAGGDPGWAGQ